MARKQTEGLVCRHCKLPIKGREETRAMTWLSVGPVHGPCNERHWAAVAALTEKAVSEGRHTRAPPPEPETPFERAARLSEGFKYTGRKL